MQPRISGARGWPRIPAVVDTLLATTLFATTLLLGCGAGLPAERPGTGGTGATGGSNGSSNSGGARGDGSSGGAGANAASGSTGGSTGGSGGRPGTGGIPSPGTGTGQGTGQGTGGRGDSGSGPDAGTTEDAAPGADAAASATAAALCVDTINMYRATLGLAPYAPWGADMDTCASSEALSDSQTNRAHGAFGMCTENAQDECPGWGGAPESVITGCLKQMWAEGPGTDFATHGHYINMSSTKYTRAACGFATTPTGKIWATQNFK